MNENRAAVAMLFLSAFLWSTSGVLIKLVSLQPLAIGGWRSLIAGMVILVLCRRAIKITWGVDTLLAAVCMCLFCTCFVVATKLTTAANAIVLQYASSAYVAVLAPRMLGEPTRRQDWFFLLLVVGGICLFFLDAFSARGTWGILVGIIGSLFWALATIFLRKARVHSTAWPLALGNFMAAALCLPFMFRQSPSPAEWLGLAGLGVVSLGAGYAVFAYAIKRVRALEAVLICSVEPLINPIWVFLFTGEKPGLTAVIGGAIVLLSVTARGLLIARRVRPGPIPI